MPHNNKLKFDTTMLQTNTACCLIAFLIIQRDIIKRITTEGIVTKSELDNVNEDCEYILSKHIEALHRRCGQTVYPKTKSLLEDENIEFRQWKVQMSHILESITL
tara:strand:+ start:382 stop:696 length:315 start_codon:yes stop_codon:yes gene_type:complete